MTNIVINICIIFDSLESGEILLKKIIIEIIKLTQKSNNRENNTKVSIF